MEQTYTSSMLTVDRRISDSFGVPQLISVVSIDLSSQLSGPPKERLS